VIHGSICRCSRWRPRPRPGRAPLQKGPSRVFSTRAAVAGKQLFHTIGCSDCHTPNLGTIEGLRSDLLHDMGALLGGGSYGQQPMPSPGSSPGNGPAPSEWRTPPLWGVVDSLPCLHDGRATSVVDAIRLHDSQARRSAERFREIPGAEQAQLIAFLGTLLAP
jgi:CxxC motif-containing protein (DUF1111 family)